MERDGPALRSFDVGVAEMHQLWLTEGMPADSGDDALARHEAVVIPQPATFGSLFELVTFRPGVESPKHRTATIDYVVILSGEIVLGLDDTEVQLWAGDAVVQRATTHSWHNRSNASCTMAVVMLSTETDPNASGEIELGE